MKIFILRHVVDFGGENEDFKDLGVFSTRERAEEALKLFQDKAGFKNNPRLIKPIDDEDVAGFCIEESILDKCSDFWSEGFCSWDEAAEDQVGQ
jgi:hypothetical protein